MLVHAHTPTCTGLGGGGGQSWFIPLGQCLAHPPFSLSTFSRDSGRDQKVWVPCPFSARGEGVRGSVCLSWPGQEKFASGASSALLSPEAPGQCSSWEGPAVQMCRVPWSWHSWWAGRGLLAGEGLGPRRHSGGVSSPGWPSRGGLLSASSQELPLGCVPRPAWPCARPSC